MSDPAKSSEIEDVLASIRKLVSVDPTGGLARNSRAAPKKLMLTSDFRVGSGDDHNGDDDGDVSDAQTAPLVLEARDDPQDDDVPPMLGPTDDRQRHGSDSFKFEQGSDLGKLQIVTEDSESEDANPDFGATESYGDRPETLEDPEDADTDPAGPDTSLEARIAQLEAAVSNEGTDFEPDGSEDLRQHRPDRVPEAHKHLEAELTDAIAALVFDTEPQDADSAEPDQSDDLNANVPDTDEAPEAESDISEDVAPDGFAEFVSHASRVKHREPDEDPERLGDDRSEADPSIAVNDASFGPKSALPYADDESDLLDEAALRALVAEIVRSELQGALGERITRNVRKLVRREIMRAITVRDMG